MKRTSHILKYWLLNRITWGYAAFAAVLAAVCACDFGPHLNAAVIFFSLMFTLLWMGWTDENPRTSGERLMLRHLSRMC